MFAFAHVRPIRNEASISAAAAHAIARDESAKKRRREGYTGPRTLGCVRDREGSWKYGVLYPDGHPDAPDLPDGEFPPIADYPAAYGAHLKRHDARRPANAHCGMHIIAGISPEFFDDEEHGRTPGDPDYKGSKHDPDGAAVRRLTAAAVNWAESELGGVWAARYDVDEKGSAIVDILCSPIRPHGKTGRNWISVRKAQNEVKKTYPFAARGYGAMQSSWADYATGHLGETFLRGKPKRETGREHLIAEQYGEAMDAGREAVAALEAEASRLARTIKTLSATVKELQAKRDRLTARLKKTVKAVSAIGGRLTAWAVSRYRAADRPTLPPDPETDELADEATDLAAVLLTITTDTDEPTERHLVRIKKKVRKKRREGGWAKDDPEEAPLHEAWEAAMGRLAESARLDYPAWRHELAQVPARRVTDDQRDLIRLARRVEKSLGLYETRAERRRRKAGDAAESGGGIAR